MTDTPMRIDPDGVDRPQLESYGWDGIEIRERGTSIGDGRWIHCRQPIEARE